jgi:hypothetical protein
MARKLYELEEAAEMLGITAEQLNTMRDRREVYAVRDGGAWKFKAEEVERLLAERGADASAEQNAPEFAELDEHLDSILLSEVELGQSGPSPSSTVIGKSNAPSSPESDIQIAKPGPAKPDDSELKLDFGASDVRLASGSDLSKQGSGLSSKFDDLDALDLDMPSPAESGISSGISLGSDALRLAGKDDLTLEDQSLSLGEEARTSAPDLSGESAIDLSGGDDDELVLGGSGPGSDVTRSASDSGISLVDPTDSGLSLETSDLQLGGSTVESLELGEDDMILLDEQTGDPDAATQLKADDDFLLTPLEETGGEESDSGSQVIALDAEGDFDESAATMLGSGMSGLTALDDDGEGLGAGVGDLGGIGAGPGATPAHALMSTVAAGPEMTFAGWQIAFLAICLVFLILGGMMMYDLMRNMWSWGGAYNVNSSLMDTILSWFEK